MKTKYEWNYKIILKEKPIAEFKYEALSLIGGEILEGKFSLEVEKGQEVSNV